MFESGKEAWCDCQGMLLPVIHHKCPVPLALDGRCSVAGGCPAVKDALHEPLQGDSVLFCIVGSVCCWEVDLVGVDLMGGHHWFS